jgi:DNA-binding NtrC family response regulator
MAGEELLIADSVDRDGLRKLFDDAGYVCTSAADVDRAKELVRRKFFPVALIDLDFGGTNAGLELARFVRDTSQPTRLVMLAGRRSFDAVVEAMRLGAVDVVSKRPDQIAYLQTTVQRATDLSRGGDRGAALMFQVKEVLDESLRIMVAMARKVYGGPDSSGTGMNLKPAILIIDEDAKFLQKAAMQLGERPWDVSIELSGGSGLDRASTFNFQIVAVRDQLTDLPGSTLLRSAQAQQPQLLGLLYTLTGEGRAERYEAGQPTRSWPLTSPDSLVRCLEELVTELALRKEERRYMQAFRNEYSAFFKRFAELKARIDQIAE